MGLSRSISLDPVLPEAAREEEAEPASEPGRLCTAQREAALWGQRVPQLGGR